MSQNNSIQGKHAMPLAEADRSLSAEDICQIIHLACREGTRLQRKFGFPKQDAEDFRQELLVDLFARLKHFDPARGPFGAFAKTVMRHQASRLAKRHCDRLTAQGGAMLPLEAITGAATDHASVSSKLPDDQLALQTALKSLYPSDRRFCHALSQHPVAELAQADFGSRSSIYRRIRRLRPHLVISGFGPGWDVFVQA